MQISKFLSIFFVLTVSFTNSKISCEKTISGPSDGHSNFFEPADQIAPRRIRSAGALPEVHMNVPQVIRYYGYSVENHTVQTADLYQLTIFRLPCKTAKTVTCKPVLLQHGLFASASAWIFNLPNQSLAYILADQGYDVWLGNSRGNRYSQRHVNLSIHQSDFWDFSWQDMANYDLPATIDYILNFTGKSHLSYVGHSQGTLIGFAKFSSDATYAKKVNHFFALAPISTVRYVECPPRSFIELMNKLQIFLDLSGYFPTSEIRHKVNFICVGPVMEKLCSNLIFEFCGPQSKKNMNESRIAVYLALAPDETSIKNLVHFGQMVESGKMQKYNYRNAFKNLQIYNQTTPPTYDVSQMQTNTTVFCSRKDKMADEKDVQNLVTKIRKITVEKIDDFSHVDFLWALQAQKLVYSKIVKILNEIP